MMLPGQNPDDKPPNWGRAEHGREHDAPFITVNRNVPIWALVLGLIGIVTSSVALQMGQTKQSEKTQELSSKVDQLITTNAADFASKLEMKYAVEGLRQQVAAQQQALITVQQQITVGSKR